jgi:hypothetical protein
MLCNGEKIGIHVRETQESQKDMHMQVSYSPATAIDMHMQASYSPATAIAMSMQASYEHASEQRAYSSYAHTSKL